MMNGGVGEMERVTVRCVGDGARAGAIYGAGEGAARE